ncbi:MAG: prolyl oligopeptidase family serine peptidase [Lachnospiraceae bacterium]|nr:prolyl oligopeptidase family serine peptidase [Lachnospiraceae bacterium]
MKKLSNLSLITIISAGLSMTVLSGCGNIAAPAFSNTSVKVKSQDTLTGPSAEDEVQAKEPLFTDGMAQPILEYTNLRAEDYTNEGSDILRFCVYVETDHDTDSDGKADLVEALVQIPRAAAEGGFKAATIYDPTPYGAGTVEETSMDSSRLMNPVPFDYDKLYEPGEKRTPKGSMTTLEAADEADPECWNYEVPYSKALGYGYAQIYDYYLVRGFAVVEAGGIGTYGSEGFELCGFDLERDAHKCVVEWLAGDRIAYTDPYNDIAIEADWSNGNVAMTGCSYGGTLPFEVATTGVKGLKTIIPFAGIASWYDYTNSQGAPLYLSASYANHLASYNSGAAFEDDDWTVINDDYASFLWQISQDQDATNGNYDKIWAMSDYSLDSDKIGCSALIVHGMNDFNVTTKQSDLMARAFKKAGQNFKLVLHQDGHNFLNGILVNGELWQEIMNKWLSHYLYDVDNGIENMPTVSVQSNVDGSFKTYDTWAEFEYDSYEYDKEVNPDDVSHIDTTAIASHYMKYDQATDDFDRELLRDNFYLSMPESTKATYVFELPDNYTFYGVPEVHLRMSTRNAGGDGMVVSAMLMDTIDEETDFKAYMTKERLYYRLPVKTLGAKETGGGLPRTKVKEFVKSNTTAKLITFGHTDLANYGGGYNGKDYVRKEEEMKAGEYYDYTIYLQPTSYTFEPGHKAVLVITGWDPYQAFLDEDYMNGVVTDSVDSAYTYSFNIDNSSFELKFPQNAD